MQAISIFLNSYLRACLSQLFQAHYPFRDSGLTTQTAETITGNIISDTNRQKLESLLTLSTSIEAQAVLDRAAAKLQLANNEASLTAIKDSLIATGPVAMAIGQAATALSLQLPLININLAPAVPYAAALLMVAILPKPTRAPTSYSLRISPPAPSNTVDVPAPQPPPSPYVFPAQPPSANNVTDDSQAFIPEKSIFYDPDKPNNGLVNNTLVKGCEGSVFCSKGGKQNIRDTGLRGIPDDQIQKGARDKSIPKDQRKRYQKEEKARTERNKQKRNSQ